jgi:membrane protease YdiL (CAAX protease family)
MLTRAPARPASTSRSSDEGGRPVRQLRRREVVGVWAAAALPMAALAWLVAPAVADGGGAALGRALIVCLTLGLAWQFVLVVALVAHEQRTLRWPAVRRALWLTSPTSPRTGRTGGRTWLVLVPLVVALAAVQLLPALPAAEGRDLGAFLETAGGEALFAGSWGWFLLAVTMFVLNTVLGEELLFRGFLLPRMSGAFGDRDWLANGVLFAVYHLHVPWAIPVALLDTALVAYPSRRYRSALIGISVHSAQSVVLTLLLLTLVLR